MYSRDLVSTYWPNKDATSESIRGIYVRLAAADSKAAEPANKIGGAEPASEKADEKPVEKVAEKSTEKQADKSPESPGISVKANGVAVAATS